MAGNSALIRSRIKKAQQLLQQNNLTEATLLLEQLCRSRHQDEELWLTLAVVYRRLGRHKEAEATCMHVLSQHERHARAQHIYGSIQQCIGNLDEAIARYKLAIRLDPTLAEAHYFLGNALQLGGRTEESAESYRQALQYQPVYLEAMSNLGAALIALHRFDEARTILENAHRNYPDQVQILCNLGELSLMEDNTGAAMRFAETAIRIQPQFFDAHYLIGKICRQQGGYDEALRNFRTALKIQPDNENVIGSMAELLEVRGHYDEANALVTPMIERGTLNPLILTCFSALARQYNNEKQAAGILERAISTGGLETNLKIKLHSELGKQYDHLREHQRAFSHYRQANLLERQLNEALRIDTEAGYPGPDTIRQWQTEFGSDFWRNLPVSDETSNRPIFVIGMPRSGTTLMEQILSSHPNVHGAGELPDIAEIARQIGVWSKGYGGFRNLAGLDKVTLSRAAEKYMDSLDKHSTTALHVVDKMPTNFWHLGVIHLLFPNTCVIHMKRDPRDVCLSMYFQRFGSLATQTTDLLELGGYYSAYTGVMDYWRSVLDIRIMDLQYEELVNNQEITIRKLLNFCGLEWHDNCLCFYESGRDVNTPSYDQVRQPMYSKSVGRWKNYENELAPLIKVLDPECFYEPS